MPCDMRSDNTILSATRLWRMQLSFTHAATPLFRSRGGACARVVTCARFVMSSASDSTESTGTSEGAAPATARAAVESIGVFYSAKFLRHRAPAGRDHPECPERLMVCVSALKADPELSARVGWHEPPAVVDSEDDKVLKAVRAVHDNEDYLDEVRRVSRTGGALDSDTYVAPGSWDIALLAASAWIAAVDMALHDGTPAFALARPPGHHATPATGMGFCLLSNAAIAAKYALQVHGLSRVSIYDPDVHHGNGTEAAVRDEPRIRLVSSHQYPLYPMSGAEGVSENVMNVNFSEGATMEEYLPRFKDEMLPHLLHDGEQPELVIVSAGYDALDDDPLAGLCLQPSDYNTLMRVLLEKMPDAKIVMGLEGGYSLAENGISAAFCETLRAFFPSA